MASFEERVFPLLKNNILRFTKHEGGEHMMDFGLFLAEFVEFASVEHPNIDRFVYYFGNRKDPDSIMCLTLKKDTVVSYLANHEFFRPRLSLITDQQRD